MKDGASTGRVGIDWLEDILLRRLGDDAYRRWTESDLSFDDAEVESVFAELDRGLRRAGSTVG